MKSLIETRIKTAAANQNGVALTEFALVAPVLLLTLMGLFDLGYRAYLNQLLYGEVQKAGRDSSLESGSGQQAAIDAKVRAGVGPVMMGGTLTVTRIANYSFQSSGSSEPFTDGNGNNSRDAGECFTDENGDGTWQSAAGAAGLGGSDDIVTYKASITYNRLFPMAGLIGWSPTQTVTATTILRNQPYGQAAGAPSVICT